MTEIKICGITSMADAECCAGAGADYIGFVFARSPRRIAAGDAARIAACPGLSGIKKVGVFVNEDELAVKRTAEECGLDVLQFHGDESPRYCARFGAMTVFKAFRLKGPEDIAPMKHYRVDALLVDAYVRGIYGGTGKTLSTELALEARRAAGKLVLSGGLTPENVARSVAAVRPFAVDVSGGVESSPGKKDPKKIEAFIKAVKEAEENSETAR